MSNICGMQLSSAQPPVAHASVTYLLPRPSMFIQILLIQGSLLSLLLAEDAVVPFLYPGHDLSMDTVVANEVNVALRAVTVYPETRLSWLLGLHLGLSFSSVGTSP